MTINENMTVGKHLCHQNHKKNILLQIKRYELFSKGSLHYP